MLYQLDIVDIDKVRAAEYKQLYRQLMDANSGDTAIHITAYKNVSDNLKEMLYDDFGDEMFDMSSLFDWFHDNEGIIDKGSLYRLLTWRTALSVKAYS